MAIGCLLLSTPLESLNAVYNGMDQIYEQLKNSGSGLPSQSRTIGDQGRITKTISQRVMRLFISTMVIAMSVLAPSQAQTSLSLGQVAFTGYRSDDPDQFTIVFLTDVSSGTQISFTDRSWDVSEASGFVPESTSNEGSITLTLSNAFSCGTELYFVETSGTWAAYESDESTSAGAISESGVFTLHTDGDQIFAYQGSIPTSADQSNFLAVIHMNNGWDADGGSNEANSEQPTTFSSGNYSVVITPETDGAEFDCGTTNEPTSSIINDESNWTSDDTNINLDPYCTFNACPFDFSFCDNCSSATGDCAIPSVATNPDLDAACTDLQLAFVLDESGSIGGSEGDVEAGTMAFLSSLIGTGAEIAIIEFSVSANLVTNGYELVTPAFVNNVQGYFDGTPYNGQVYATGGNTNWQSAMLEIYDLLDAPDLDTADMVLFFTDGNPTSYSTGSDGSGATSSCSGGGSTESPEIVNPMKLANYFKEYLGTHMFMLGVGGVNTVNLERMSGPVQWQVGVNEITEADFALESFEALAECLAQFAFELCGTEVTVDVTPTPTSVCIGDVVSWTVSIENIGDDNIAQDVIFRDTLPASFTAVTCTNNCSGFCVGGGCSPSEPTNVIVWDAGDISVGQTVSMTFEITTTQTGPFTNTGWAESIVVNPTSGSGSITVTGLPTANAGPDQSVCVGETTTLTASGSGGAAPYSYEWSTGATTASTDVTPSGETTYTVTVTDVNGCTDEASVTVDVDGSPSVTVTADLTDICVGGSATLTANPSGGAAPYSYTWNNLETTQNITVSPATTTAYSVTVTDASGCTSTGTITINVSADPTVSVTVDDGEICEGGTATFDATVSGGTGASSYQWQENTGTWQNIPGATGSSYTTPVLVAGNYSYRVIVTQNSGCSVTSAGASVNVVADPTVVVTVDDNTICDGGAATLTAAVSGGTGTTSVQWEVNTGTWDPIPGANSTVYTTPSLSIGTYEYRVVVTQDDGCNATSVPTSITVVGDATASITVDNPVICTGGSATLDVTVSGGTGPFSYQWQQSATGTGGWTNISGATASSYSPPTGVSGTTFYRVVVIDASTGCANPTSNVLSIDIIDDPVVFVTVDNPGVCVGGTATFTANVSGGTGTNTYQWQFNNGGTWQNVTGAASISYAPLLLTPGTFEYRVIVTQTAGCADTSAGVSVTVIADPTVTASIDNSEICAGGSITVTAAPAGGSGTTTYQWEENNGGTWQPIAGATGIQYSTILGTPGSYEYRVQIQQDPGCEATSNIVSVNVLPDPSVSISVNSTDLCVGGTAIFSSSVTGGSGSNSYQWEFNNSGTWQPVSGATSSTYSILLLNPGTFEYRLVVTQSSGCSSTSAPASVTVVADPTVSVTLPSSDICEGGQVTMTANVSGGSGTSDFQWQENSSGTWQNIPGATLGFYTTPVLTVGSYSYRVIVSQNEGCAVTSAASTITVVADPTVSITASTTDLCDGGSVQLTSSVSGGVGATTYQWQLNTGGGFNDIPGATATSYNSGPLAPGTYEYRLFIQQNEGCDEFSNEITVTVIPDPTVSVTADDLSVCEGGTATLSATVSGGTGTTLYQWQIENSGWQDIGGANGPSYTTPTLAVGAFQYRVVITQGDGCSVTSAAVTVTAVADPTVSVSVDNPTICAGGVATFTATVSGGNGTTSLQWEYNDPVNGWEIVAGETGPTFTPTGLPIGVFEYRVSITQDPGCAATSAPASVTVVADPSVSIAVDNSEACEGSSVNFTSTVTGGTGGNSYQWQNNDPVNGWVDIPGATASTYSTGPLAIGSFEYRLIVTQNDGCSAVSNELTITVVAAPLVSVSVDDSEICEGGTATFTATVSGGPGGTTYQWQFNSSGTWGDIAGATSNVYSVNLINAGTFEYRVQVFQTGGCNVTSAPIAVNVVADPTVTVSVLDATICEGGTAEFSASVTGGNGIPSYQWQFNNGGTWQNVGGATSSTYSIALLNAGTYEYRVIVTQDSGCETISAGATVTVVEDPTVVVTLSDVDICEGGTAEFDAVVSGGSGSSTYQWQFNNSGTWEDVSGATSASYDVVLASPGTYEYRVVVTQDAGCGVTSDGVTVTVVGDPEVTIVADQTSICDGGSVEITATATGGSGSNNFQWQINNSGWEDIVGETGAVFNSPTLGIGTYEYRVVLSQDSGCDDISDPITITVVADPVVSVSADDASICSGGVVTLTASISGGTGANSIQWEYNNLGTWEPVAGATSTIFTTPVLAIGSHQYRVVVSQNNGCATTSSATTITVVADPTVNDIRRQYQHL